MYIKMSETFIKIDSLQHLEIYNPPDYKPHKFQMQKISL